MKQSFQKLMVALGLVLTLSLPTSASASSRSWKSWFIEQYFWLKRDKSYYAEQDDTSFQNYLNACREQSDKPYELDPSTVNGQLVQENLFDMQVYSWNDNGKPNQKTIFYLAGGSYLNNPTSYHISMLKTLSTSLDAKIILPIYPKAPRYTYDYAMPRLVNLYKHYQEKNQELFLMGDSAGGGLALGLAHALNNESVAQPKQIILLSPWLDVTMSHAEIPNYEEADPILSAWGLKRVGALWANSSDNTNHIYVSPKNGPIHNLAPITLFTGTREIFYPDIRDYAAKLQAAKHQVTYIAQEGMNHVYPIYPIEEAKTAQYQIIDAINKTP
ncbi:Monoterpene epsilon-lactone hydrolase [Streptococcus canis]|uniref:Monoterpene epsilon-lactone hydrolase n=1 Tax=Streptococcus canis TaxID=1329 RepID=A0A3P5Y8B0_STRCB|nr:alpha/beta hydrolase [Streptococcus canis]QKG78110.1 alpha/beta hydrolase [Streptococcus canis]VDC43389.1 Monoterpene epsilon-lactone hydrolase [Streptococcus canis]